MCVKCSRTARRLCSLESTIETLTEVLKKHIRYSTKTPSQARPAATDIRSHSWSMYYSRQGATYIPWGSGNIRGAFVRFMSWNVADQLHKECMPQSDTQRSYCRPWGASIYVFLYISRQRRNSTCVVTSSRAVSFDSLGPCDIANPGVALIDFSTSG